MKDFTPHRKVSPLKNLVMKVYPLILNNFQRGYKIGF
jgi:hypothetical protein